MGFGDFKSFGAEEKGVSLAAVGNDGDDTVAMVVVVEEAATTVHHFRKIVRIFFIILSSSYFVFNSFTVLPSWYTWRRI